MVGVTELLLRLTIFSNIKTKTTTTKTKKNKKKKQQKNNPNEMYENIEIPTTDDEPVINNEEINDPVTENEITEAVKSLKNNKSSSIGEIMNEYMKASFPHLLSTNYKLFNKIFDKDIIPQSWLIGNILAIYKNKGDEHNPENYRPITL